MGKPHKLRNVLPRWAVEQSGRHATHKVCMCDYGDDHDETTSISGQDREVHNRIDGPTNDMVQVARRERWTFTSKDEANLINWIETAEYENGHRKPVPFAVEIIKHIKASQ